MDFLKRNIRKYRMVVLPIIAILLVQPYKQSLGANISLLTILSGIFSAFIVTVFAILMLLPENRFTKCLYVTRVWNNTLYTLLLTAVAFFVTVFLGLFFQGVLVEIPFMVGFADMLLCLSDLFRICHYARRSG